MRSAWVLTAALGLVATAACGGGGGGGGGPSTPTPPQASIELTVQGAVAPAVRLARGAGSGPTTLALEIRADSLQSLYGLAFDLTYPSGLLRYDGFAEGGFLDGDGASTSLQVARVEAGRLVVGHSRLGDVGTTTGSGLLLTLRFTAVGAGTGSIAFSRNRAFDAEGEEIPGVSWAGATVRTVL